MPTHWCLAQVKQCRDTTSARSLASWLIGHMHHQEEKIQLLNFDSMVPFMSIDIFAVHSPNAIKCQHIGVWLKSSSAEISSLQEVWHHDCLGWFLGQAVHQFGSSLFEGKWPRVTPLQASLWLEDGLLTCTKITGSDELTHTLFRSPTTSQVLGGISPPPCQSALLMTLPCHLPQPKS